jgi:hypothetical protein
MFDVLCQDSIRGFSMGREVDLPAHLLTPNDNTPAVRANHREKQRFEIIRRARCGAGVSACRQTKRRRRRNMSPPSA